MMRKRLLVICMACLLTACSQTGGQAGSFESSGAVTGTVIDPRAWSGSSSVEEPPLVGMPNPVVEYETADFAEAAGFAVTGYPEGDGLSLSRCALIAGEVAELEFSLDEPGLTATLRVAAEKGEDISGVYGQRYEETRLEERNGVVLEMNASAGGPFLARWSKGGYAFTLWMEQAPMGVFGGILPRFLTAEAVPGKPDAAAPVAAVVPGFDVAVARWGEKEDPLLSLGGLSDPPARCWVVGGRVAQYEWGDAAATPAILRVADEDAGDISGCYYPAPTNSRGGEARSETIDGIAVTLHDCDNGNFRADWVKGGARFHLWLPTYDLGTLQRFLRAEVLAADVIVD